MSHPQPVPGDRPSPPPAQCRRRLAGDSPFLCHLPLPAAETVPPHSLAPRRNKKGSPTRLSWDQVPSPPCPAGGSPIRAVGFIAEGSHGFWRGELLGGSVHKVLNLTHGNHQAPRPIAACSGEWLREPALPRRHTGQVWGSHWEGKFCRPGQGRPQERQAAEQPCSLGSYSQ